MRTKMMAMVMMSALLTASFAIAADDVNVSVDNSNTVNATGGNANSDQNQNQGQKQDQNQDAHSSAVTNAPRNHVNAIPGMSGTLMSISPIIADGKWHQRLCEEFTVEELKIMRDSSSYANREGLYILNIFKSPIKGTLRVKRYSGDISDAAVVRLVPDHPRNKVVAEYEGHGAKGVPMSAILAYAALEGVSNTNEYSLVVEYRTRDIASITGVGVGSGAAAAVSSNDSARTGSMSVGAIIGFSEAYTEYVYDIKVKVVRASAEALAAARCFEEVLTPVPVYTPPLIVVPPAPQPPAACNPDEIWYKIHELEREVAKCTRYCYNNLTLRQALGDLYIELYVCTGNRKYLSSTNGAAYHFGVAERNFRLGFDIRNHKSEANQVIAQVYYNWAGVIYQTEGRERAMEFAKAKRLERIPNRFTR